MREGGSGQPREKSQKVTTESSILIEREKKTFYLGGYNFRGTVYAAHRLSTIERQNGRNSE